MGRMSDARKRAAQRKRGSAPAGPPEPPSQAAESADGEWVSRAESLVFPAENPAPAAPGRIALPSSGLAEEILARAEAAAVEAAPAWTATAAPAAQAIVPVPAPEDASRTHNISFFAAPNREEKKTIEATEHLVTFFLAQEEYGVDVRLVQEIIRVADITQVPRAPEFIRGVINLRGRIIPVVDLKRSEERRVGKECRL